MKQRLKKWLAGLLGAALMFGMTGCLGNLYDNVGVIDGTEISAGLYQMAQMSAYLEARNLVEDSEKDVTKQKVEGQSYNSWVRSRTEELLRQYVCVQRMARERSITLDSTSQENVEQMMQYWTYIEEIYAENGISEYTMRRYMNNEQLRRQLFENMYGKDGELAVPDAELKEEYGNQNAHLRFISMPVTSSEDSSDKSAEVEAIGEEMVAQLQAGKAMEDVVAEGVAKVYKIIGRDFDRDAVVESITTTYIRYDQDNYDTYSEAFLANLKAQEIGGYGSYNMGSTLIVYEKIATFENQDEFENMRTTVLEAIKTEAFEEYLKGLYSEYPVSWSFGARWYYRPGKITYF